MAKSNSKGGRPPKPDHEKRTSRLTIVLTQAERERYEQAAEAKGMRLSEWIRDLCDRAAKRQKR